MVDFGLHKFFVRKLFAHFLLQKERKKNISDFRKAVGNYNFGNLLDPQTPISGPCVSFWMNVQKPYFDFKLSLNCNSLSNFQPIRAEMNRRKIMHLYNTA